MNSRIQIGAAALVLVVGLFAWPAANGEKQADEQPHSLEALLKERQATLRQLVEVVTAGYRQGTMGYDAVARATEQMLDADLALAEDADARIAIFQRRIDLMESVLSMVEANFATGQASQAQVLTARAELLESRILLAREEARGDRRQP